MSALPPPPDGNRDRAPKLLAIFWAQISISFLFVAARAYVRISIKRLRWDDYTMFACWGLYLMALIGSTFTVANGGARHLYYLTPQELHAASKWNWISQPFGTMAIAFGKISVGLLLLNIIGPNTKWRKWTIWINLTFFFIVSILASLFNYVQCNPPRALWDVVPDAKCWDPRIQPDFAIFVSSYSTLLDFFLALLPITIVWNLHLNTARKLALAGLLGTGVFAGICAAIKTAQLHSLSARADLTWSTFGLYAWSSSELFLIVICGSIPTLKPLYDKWEKGKPLVPKKSSHYREYSGGSYKMRANPAEFSGKTEVSDASETQAGTLTQITCRGDSASSVRDENNINVTHGYDVHMVPKGSHENLV